MWILFPQTITFFGKTHFWGIQKTDRDQFGVVIRAISSQDFVLCKQYPKKQTNREMKGSCLRLGINRVLSSGS